MASRSWNRIELIGNLTRDPELRYTPNGAAVATLGLATNRSYLLEGERKEEVDFHKIIAWNKLAELCSQLLKKGNKVFISGRLQYREWEGQDQVKRREAEIVLEDMLVLTPKGESSGHPESAEEISLKEASTPKPEKEKKVEAVEEAPPVANEKVSDDDLPF